MAYALRPLLSGSDGHLTEGSRTEHRAYTAGSTTSDVRTALSAQAAHAVPRAMEPVIEIASLASAASGSRSRPAERAT